jgi:hypothetical protein
VSLTNSGTTGEEFPSVNYATHGDEKEQYIVPTADKESFNATKEAKLRPDDCLLERQYKNLRTVLQEWLATPAAMAIPQACVTDLLQRFHGNEHIFAKGQLDNLWKTGSGLARIPVRVYKDIKFRNLLDYRPETDDFPTPVPKISQAAKKKQSSNILPDDECDSNNKRDWNDEEGSGIESSSDDDSCRSSGAEADDDNDSDYKGDGGRIQLRDEYGIEAQLQNDAVHNCPIQEMAYFGIEKVLVGENPGIFDYEGYTNALRTIALLDPNAFSDRLVGDLFKGLPITAVSWINIL